MQLTFFNEKRHLGDVLPRNSVKRASCKRRFTLSPPITLRLYTLPYWSNPPFLISDIRALWRSVLSARMSKIKNSGLDQYGAEPFEQQQFETLASKGLKIKF